MKRLLHTSSDPRRLNNLKALLLLIPLAAFCVITLSLGVTFTYAGDFAQSPQFNIGNIVFNIGKLNREQTFPPKIITLSTYSGDEKFMVFGETSLEVLNEIDYVVDFDDLVTPDKDEIISDGAIIRVVKVDVEVFTKQEDINYAVKNVQTDELTTGTLSVSQEGVLGLREKKIRVIYEDGMAVKSEVIEDTVLKDPVNKIVKIGTKVVGIQSCSHWDSVIDRYTTAGTTKNKWMKYVMRCETWCDSGQNTRNTYFGLYQFNARTFRSKGGVNIYDGTEQIRIVANMYEGGEDYRSHQWPSCNKSFNAKY